MAHGEYKMPGGKLVIVEFEVKDGRLRDVEVSGDFFLYPDEVLEAITGSLQNLPANLPEASYAANVQAAIPAGATVMGVTAEGVAIAVLRAIAEAGKP